MPGKLIAVLSRWFLGSSPGRRERVILTLLTMAGYVTFALLQEAEVRLGYIDPRESNWLTAYNLSGSILFYLLVRTGWSERLSPAEPSMTFVQTVHGVVAIVGSYAITGPARGAVLAILVLVLAYGMFSLTVQQARGLAVFALFALVAVMVWKHRTRVDGGLGGVEAVHLQVRKVLLDLVGVHAVAAANVNQGLVFRLDEAENFFRNALVGDVGGELGVGRVEKTAVFGYIPVELLNVLFQRLIHSNFSVVK